jgi:hypothetical protein
MRVWEAISERHKLLPGVHDSHPFPDWNGIEFILSGNVEVDNVSQVAPWK